jgi:hypothetical protein
MNAKTTTTYTPHEGTVPYRVIQFFTTNPDEELDKHALEAKFGKPANQFPTILSAAVDAGILKRRVGADDELIWSMGNGCKTVTANAGRHPSAKPDALAMGAALGLSVTQTNNLDLDNMTMLDDVPLPPAKRGRTTQQDWPSLLARMTVNQCTPPLPMKVRSMANKAITTATKAGTGVYAIRVLDKATFGIWRTA